MMKLHGENKKCQDVFWRKYRGKPSACAHFFTPKFARACLKDTFVSYFYAGCCLAAKRKECQLLRDEKGRLSSKEYGHDTRREDRSWRMLGHVSFVCFFTTRNTE